MVSAEPVAEAPAVTPEVPFEPEAVEPAPAEYVTAEEVKAAVENPKAVFPTDPLAAAFEALQAKLAALEAKVAEAAKPDPVNAMLVEMAQRAGDRDKSTKLVEWPEGDDPNAPPKAQGDTAEILSAPYKPQRVETLPGGMVVYHS